MQNDLSFRINGCWLGKAIGGTLGAPVEGKAGPLDLRFYEPVPTGVLPNDDLDLQLVWLHHLLATGAREVTTETMIDAWRAHVGFPYDEYGICLRNAAYGLHGAQAGAVDNWFAECMGAAIRSELWACLAPGEPERAAAFAWTDAVCDHAGDGVWAEVFLAALESAAFVGSNRARLLDEALGFLPSASRVSRAVTDTRKWWRETGDWRRVREEIMGVYGGENFSDVAANLAFTILGWLAGGGDFGESILIAANCGEDTDCTAATLGSILGILDPGAIPAKWKAPIGDRIVLSREIVGLTAPATLADLTADTLRLRGQLADANPAVGTILPRQPATAENSPIRIPARLAWSESGGCFDAETPLPSDAFRQETTLPGHWLRREAAEFAAPVQWLHCKLRLDEPTSIRLSAWSQTRTAVWLDGARIAPLAGHEGSRFDAPAFHRGGRGKFDSARALDAGEHDFVIAWEASGSPADLVIGAADASNQQWLPWALAGKK